MEELWYFPVEFKASSGWVSNVQTRHGNIGMNLHGEANGITAKERETIMAN